MFYSDTIEHIKRFEKEIYVLHRAIDELNSHPEYQVVRLLVGDQYFNDWLLGNSIVNCDDYMIFKAIENAEEIIAMVGNIGDAIRIVKLVKGIKS